MSTKSWPWAAWTVLAVSNIRQISESFEVEGGGVAAVAAGSTDSLAVVSPVEEGRGGATSEDSTLGHLELALIWVALFLRKVASIGAIIWTGSDVGNSSNPRCNKIQWIKTGKKRKTMQYTSIYIIHMNNLILASKHMLTHVLRGFSIFLGKN